MELKNKNIPNFIYGTAWKEDATEDLVLKAIEIGFRGIDTANQRMHYNEAAVGNAISKVLKNGIKREELFIQTKYTYPNDQDHRIPYDIKSDFRSQVRLSFQSSINHLQIDYIDSYVMHGPSGSIGLSQDDWYVWQEMEAIHKEQKVKFLGISNINIEQLILLFKESYVKPTFVQNRCFAQYGWDKDVREFCKKNGIIYQGFSLLTANSFVLPKIEHIANKLSKTPAQILFRFSMHVGILPLTGTTNKIHMKEDIALDFSLKDEDIHFIENIGTL